MDAWLRQLCREARTFSSEAAYDWLITRYPPEDRSKSGGAYQVIPHRSWKRREQIKLFWAYFAPCGLASSRPLLVFASIMSKRLLLQLLHQLMEGDWTGDERRLSLLHHNSYGLRGCLTDPADQDELRTLQAAVKLKLDALQASKAALPPA